MGYKCIYGVDKSMYFPSKSDKNDLLPPIRTPLFLVFVCLRRTNRIYVYISGGVLCISSSNISIYQLCGGHIVRYINCI